MIILFAKLGKDDKRNLVITNKITVADCEKKLNVFLLIKNRFVILEAI